MFTHEYRGGYIHGYVDKEICQWSIWHSHGTARSYRAAQLAITRKIRELYLEYLNDFISTKGFAYWYDKPFSEASKIIEEGRELAYKTGKF